MDVAAILDRVEQRLKAVGLSADAASRAAGTPDGIRNLRRAVKSGATQGPSPATLNAWAPVLKTTSVWLLAGAGREVPRSAAEQVDNEIVEDEPAADESLRVRDTQFVEAVYGGTLQAGNWREVDDFEGEDREPEVMPRDKQFPRERYVIYDVAGDSMNAADPPMPPGCQVLAIATDNPSRPIPLRTGDLVVIQRKQAQGGLIERSVKELEMGDEVTRFLPRSTNSKHKPIVVRNDPDPEDGGVEVIGLVIKVISDARRK